MALLSADSPLMRGVVRIGDVVLLNLCFVLGCLPVVTIGASLTALDHAAMRMMRGEPTSPVDDFRAAYGQNLRQGSVLGLLTGLVLAALTAWAGVLQGLRVSNTLLLLGWAALFLVAIGVALVVPWVFGYQATFHDRLTTVVRNSRLMSVRHLGSSLVLLALLVLPAVVTAFYPVFVLYGLVWATVGFAALACARAQVLNSVFGRYADLSHGVVPA